jgi:hypothetical protein
MPETESVEQYEPVASEENQRTLSMVEGLQARVLKVVTDDPEAAAMSHVLACESIGRDHQKLVTEEDDDYDRYYDTLTLVLMQALSGAASKLYFPAKL